MKTTVYFIRHGTTDNNVGGRFQGSSDIPLGAIGLQQAAYLGERFAGLAVDAVYTSPLGEMEAFSTGRFAVDFTAEAPPLKNAEPEEHAAGLLQRAGIQAEYLDSSTAEGATRLTYRQRWSDTPVFNTQIVLTYENGMLRHMEGVLLPTGDGVSRQEETVTVATLLVRFLSQRNESGRMFSQIQSLVPGYHLSGTRPFTLTPAWYVTTDTGTYLLSALDGSLLS